MALTLDAMLAAAQDNISRRPLIEITSSSPVADIPFDGQKLTSETTAETAPNAITHSSGRLCVVYTFGSGVSAQLKYVYTDTDRSTFSFATVAAAYLLDASLCEMGDGNIEIVCLTKDGTNYYLKTLILSPTGSVASGLSTIATIAGSNWVSSPAVVRLSSGTFFLAYAYKTGTTYSIQKRTSADFSSWSAASPCSIGGLSDANRRDNVSICEASANELFLWYDYLGSVSGTAEKTNCYYSISADGGVTWGSAVAITAYPDVTAGGRHPAAIKRNTGDLTVAFHERRGALTMDDTAAGWNTGDDSIVLTFEPTSRKLYVINAWPGGGYKTLQNVVRINVDTWTVEKCWDQNSVPAFPSYLFSTVHVTFGRTHADGNLVAVGNARTSTSQWHIALLDGLADTIRTFSFQNNPTYGLTQNVTGFPSMGTGSTYLNHLWVDATVKRLYLVFVNSYANNRVVEIGYIDLSQTGPTYSYTSILHEVNQITEIEATGIQFGDFAINPEADLIILAGSNYVSSWTGFLRVYLISSGSLYKSYSNATNTGFPYRGLTRVLYKDGRVYGAFGYEPLYGQADRRGLCEVQLSDDSIRYYQPTWGTFDNYGLDDMVKTSDGLIVAAAYGHGITLFNPGTGEWILYDNTNLPGMEPRGSYQYMYRPVAFDEANGMIYAGEIASNYGWTGAVAISRYGFLRQARYLTGTKDVGWTFGSHSPLVQGLTDYEAALAEDPGDHSLYAFWTRQEGTGYSIAWDKDAAALDLAPYLLAGQDISIRRSIDGRPAELSFAVSDGPLFDPFNTNSLRSMYLKKFRKLSVRFGESVSGTSYWADAGTFILKEVRLSYERGRYPSMTVRAEDKRCLWEALDIPATPYYTTIPEEIIQSVLTTFAGELLSGINLPAFAGSYAVNHQWMDTTVKKVVEDLCYRFGYFTMVNQDDSVTARRISDSNAIDHVYADLNRILSFTPDDSYSDFTNRVTVEGESRESVEVLQKEERIETLSGTVGWWGGKKVIRVYYSEDQNRACRNPRIEIGQSVSSFNFKIGGGGESITAIDPNDKWVEITIDVPNLVPVLLAALSALLITALSCYGGLPYVSYPCFIAYTLELNVILYIISSIASYQYSLFARPVGKEKMKIQATADDLDAQAALGKVVAKRIEEPLAVTVDQCREVANQELLIARLQRRRARFVKVAHLQDEEGDTIQIPHPYTNIPLNVFVTDLTRKFRFSAPGEDDGYFLDEIEGWVLP
ncbi:MAG: hypothetical protein E4G97_01325 [Deltaproteobacteria bacterium]|nr:MAG: hypothetical protein E4G97_01325 [Deltaproteobacteria bacterium]